MPLLEKVCRHLLVFTTENHHAPYAWDGVHPLLCDRCSLAKGYDIPDAIARAKEYLTKAIESGIHLKIGHGNGPVNHLHLGNSSFVKNEVGARAEPWSEQG